MKTSVYIHIPFCKSICSYCDFCKLYYNQKWVNEYLDALEKQVRNEYKNDLIKTIYIGGGSPSALDESSLKKLKNIINIFKLDNIEFTFECNINDIDDKLLKSLKEMGVNRLSIGIESFNKKVLDFLNRKGSYKLAQEKINLCRAYGFNNINVDLIYAVPNESVEDLYDDINKIISLNVEHISTYSLMIEKNTMIYNESPIDENIDYKMYEIICQKLKENNYIHYEISNFAKEGFESKHNMTYWQNDTYYGFGLGASSYINNERKTNTRNLNNYLNGKYVFEKEIINNDLFTTYGIILGLRLIKGINVNHFNERYNVKLLENQNVKDLLKEKLLVYKDGYLKIPEDKLYIQNEILEKLI